MKIIHVNYSGSKGGAAIAAKRISRALNKDENISSILWCFKDPSGKNCESIYGWLRQKLNSIQNIILAKIIGNKEHLSINLFGSSLVSKLNSSDADIVHLHWINGEFVSIEQLSRIRKPLFWTFHDMWPFLGAQHYSDDKTFISGYDKNISNSKISSIPNLNNWVFQRKLRFWKNLNIQIICPSKWLADSVNESYLLKHQSVQVIRNCLNSEIFKPLNKKNEVRQKFNIPINKKVILFGAVSADDKRKGGDLLIAALEDLDRVNDYALVVFGKSNDRFFNGKNCHFIDTISEELILTEVYNCADVMCVPSRQDNLPNTAVEAAMCGVPVVAYDVGGLSEIIDHKVSGYLAKPFIINDLAQGIQWSADTENNHFLSKNAREKALKNFDEKKISGLYMEAYHNILSVKS